MDEKKGSAYYLGRFLAATFVVCIAASILVLTGKFIFWIWTM